MTLAAESSTFVPGPPEQRSTYLGFFIAGFGLAAWAPLVPFAQARAGLDAGTLGLVLLCFGGGSIVALPLAGAVAARLGCRRVLIAATLLICAALPLLAVISSGPLLGATLLLFGAGVGCVDCVVNILAIIVERASGRPMMSGFHGCFSLGGMLGAGAVSTLLWLGASPLAAILCVVVVLAAVLAAAAPHLLSQASEAGGPAFAIPHGIVLFIGGLCLVMFLTEAAVLDWSAVFLADVRGVDPARAGLGYAAFATTMTLGRFGGDRIVRRVGGMTILGGGGLCAAAGLTLATLVPAWQAAVLGYALVGAGCSNVVPVLYTAVGRQTVMPEHVAVPAITTMGYAGILAGPALIGFAARATSLPTVFLGLAVLLLGVAASGRALRS